MAKRQATFKDRLKILMNGDRPYTWSKKVGIDKGLFQYYWQKGKIPTQENLLKIQKATGCSLDWLLTGEAVAFGQVTNLAFEETTFLKGNRDKRATAVIATVIGIFGNGASETKLKALETTVDLYAKK